MTSMYYNNVKKYVFKFFVKISDFSWRFIFFDQKLKISYIKQIVYVLVFFPMLYWAVSEFESIEIISKLAIILCI